MLADSEKSKTNIYIRLEQQLASVTDAVFAHKHINMSMYTRVQVHLSAEAAGYASTGRLCAFFRVKNRKARRTNVSRDKLWLTEWTGCVRECVCCGGGGGGVGVSQCQNHVCTQM